MNQDDYEATIAQAKQVLTTVGVKPEHHASSSLVVRLSQAFLQAHAKLDNFNAFLDAVIGVFVERMGPDGRQDLIHKLRQEFCFECGNTDLPCPCMRDE